MKERFPSRILSLQGEGCSGKEAQPWPNLVQRKSVVCEKKEPEGGNARNSGRKEDTEKECKLREETEIGIGLPLKVAKREKAGLDEEAKRSAKSED